MVAVDTTRTSPNFTPASRVPATFGQGPRRVESITIHHWGKFGQTFDAVTDYLCRPAGASSAHYVAQDGRVACIVDPDDAAWHAGSATGNTTSVGIECRPEATDGDYDTVAQLVAELRAVYGDVPLVPHSHWKATACPGRWDLDRLDTLARTTPAPDPVPNPQEDDMPIIYRAGGERTPYGVLVQGLAAVELTTKAEYDNLRTAGVKAVWVERKTLDAIVSGLRGQYTAFGVREAQ